MKYNRFRSHPFGDPGAAFGEALGRLGGAFLGDLVAHRFFINFLSMLGRFLDVFWYQFGSKKEKELMQKLFQKQAKSKKASLSE